MLFEHTLVPGPVSEWQSVLVWQALPVVPSYMETVPPLLLPLLLPLPLPLPPPLLLPLPLPLAPPLLVLLLENAHACEACDWTSEQFEQPAHVNVCEPTVYAIEVHAPAASTDVHTFMSVPLEHCAPLVQVVFVPLPPLLLLEVLPPLPLPLLPGPLLPSHAATADSTALVQSEQLLHWKDWPPVVLYWTPVHAPLPSCVVHTCKVPLPHAAPGLHDSFPPPPPELVVSEQATSAMSESTAPTTKVRMPP